MTQFDATLTRPWVLIFVKGRTVRKFFSGGGGLAGEVPKKYSRKRKLNEKNSCTPINPKKYSCYGPKTAYKEFDNEKIFLRLENSPPPHNFSNGPSLSIQILDSN